MASKPTVTLTFAGDSADLEKKFASVGEGARGLQSDFGKAESSAEELQQSFRDVGTAASNMGDSVQQVEISGFQGKLLSSAAAGDVAERSFIGVADILDVVGERFGLPTEGAAELSRNFADLGGAAGALLPLMGSIPKVFRAIGVAMITPPQGLIVLVASLTAGLVLLATQSETFRDAVSSAFNAVMGVATEVFGTVQAVATTAFNWIKTNWPLILGILTGPFGLAVVTIATHWEEIKSGAQTVVDFFSGLPGKLSSALGGIVDAIAGPFVDAFNRIKSIYDSTVGAIDLGLLGDVVSGIGSIASAGGGLLGFAEGGVVPGMRGQPQLAIVHGGETVLPTGVQPVTVNIGTVLARDGAEAGRAGRDMGWALSLRMRGMPV